MELSHLAGPPLNPMKKLSFALFAIVAASIPLSANAAETTVPASPAARTAALLAAGADVQVSQVAIVVEPNRVEARPYYGYNNGYNNGYNTGYNNGYNGYHHHRHYRTVRVVSYRHGIRYVSYRRVYYR